MGDVGWEGLVTYDMKWISSTELLRGIEHEQTLAF